MLFYTFMQKLYSIWCCLYAMRTFLHNFWNYSDIQSSLAIVSMHTLLLKSLETFFWNKGKYYFLDIGRTRKLKQKQRWTTRGCKTLHIIHPVRTRGFSCSKCCCQDFGFCHWIICNLSAPTRKTWLDNCESYFVTKSLLNCAYAHHKKMICIWNNTLKKTIIIKKINDSRGGFNWFGFHASE